MLSGEWHRAPCNAGNCLEARFSTSSYSQSNGHCLEARFRKSAHSASGNCAEVALRHGTVDVRDSQDPDGPVLSLSPQDWQVFITGIKAG